MTSLFARGSAAANADAGLKLNLVKRFQKATLRAVSPDGTKFCLEEWGFSRYRLRVVETGTWREIFSSALSSEAASADFFEDSQALFLQFNPAAHSSRRKQTVVELAGGERIDRMYIDKNSDSDVSVHRDGAYPITGRTLLVAHLAAHARVLERLSEIEFSSGRELMRRDLTAQRDDSSTSSSLTLSTDRKLIIYFRGNELVCRRTGDLETVWIRPIKPPLRAEPLAASARGEYVAAVIKSVSSGRDRFLRLTPMYITVYDGKTGAEVSQLPLVAQYGIALSPDGRLLAIPIDEPGENGDLFSTVSVFDTLSGDRLASVVHDRIPAGRRQFLLSGCTVEFTPGGRYLITSGMLTKVWEMSGK